MRLEDRGVIRGNVARRLRYGLHYMNSDDNVFEDNLIADNARGGFLEGSSRNLFRRNVLAQSDIAIVLYGSSSENRF